MPSATDETLFGRESRLWTVLFFAAFVFLCASLCHTINLPWIEEDNYYGAVYAQAAHNNLRAGLHVTRGVPATLYFGPLPIPSEEYYVHHPTLFPLMITAAVAALGEKEWVVRLIPILCSLLSACFLWLLVRETAGRRAAALTAAFFATLPMELHYGDMVDFEPCLVLWMLATLVCLHRWRQDGGKIWGWIAGILCFCALCTDWPGYLFVAGVSLTCLFQKKGGRRLFGAVLPGIAALAGALFLFQIHSVNPGGLSNLWTAVILRLGNGVATGSSTIADIQSAHFTLGQWCGSILHAFREDYLPISWFFVIAGGIWLAGKTKTPGGFRQLAWAMLMMAFAGVPYMLLLRNWSFIHDWASFFFIGSTAILGGLGIEGIIERIEQRAPGKTARICTVSATLGMLVWLATAGFAQAEKQRSQFLMLDGETREPATLTPDVGHYLAAHFSQDTTILCNFDPYGSTLPYYTQRTILNNLGTTAEWKSAMSAHDAATGGIIWLSAPSAHEIIAILPPAEVSKVTIDGILFAVWKARLATGM